MVEDSILVEPVASNVCEFLLKISGKPYPVPGFERLTE
jgi:hypothetical protein